MIYKRYFLMSLLFMSLLNVGLTVPASAKHSMVNAGGSSKPVNTGSYTINILNASPAPGYFQAASSDTNYIIGGAPIGPSLAVEGFLAADGSSAPASATGNTVAKLLASQAKMDKERQNAIDAFNPDTSRVIALIPMGGQAQLSYPGPLKSLSIMTTGGDPVGTVSGTDLPANGGILYLLPAITSQGVKGVTGITDKTSDKYFKQTYYYTADLTQKMKVAYLDYLVKLFRSFNVSGSTLGGAQNAWNKALAGLAGR